MNKFMKSFMNEYSNDFLHYFEEHRAKKLINRKDYKELRAKKQVKERRSKCKYV